MHGSVQGKEGEAGFLLTNKKGDYLLSFPRDHTAYQGLHVFNPHLFDYYKTIDSVRFPAILIRVKNSGNEVKEEYEGGTVTYALHDAGLVIETEGTLGECRLFLDFRPIHDFNDIGRMYSVKKDGDFIVVEFKKYQDAALASLTSTHYMVILWRKEFTSAGTWVRKVYPYDRERGARPDCFVYDACAIPLSDREEIVVAFDENPTKAKIKALHLEKHEGQKILPHQEGGIAYACARESCNALTIHPNPQVYGTFAGLPWFFQFWSRDELIFSSYYLVTKKYKTMKDVLMKYLPLIRDDGRLPNRYPDSELGSADATGWLFKRFHDLFLALERQGELGLHFSNQELRHIFERAVYAIGFTNRRYGREGLVVNGPKETWMDTDYGGDAREGARIEIQGLHLALLSCAVYLGKMLKNEQWKGFSDLEELMRKRVRQLFFDGSKLADGWVNGATDWTCRPNIFIAYYAYPGLLSNREWKKVFSWALERLYLPWGGIASIDKSHPLFCPEYTGMNNRSYHRGDSWYFLNSMAALCMMHADEKEFREYIRNIYAASSEEILFSGIMGHHAEISSASSLSSKGCLAQAWSAALFAELAERMKQ